MAEETGFFADRSQSEDGEISRMQRVNCGGFPNGISGGNPMFKHYHKKSEKSVFN
ncbi:hypothetical protein [Gloeomargarita sp.]